MDPDTEIALNSVTTSVHSLHTHFYEGDLTDAVVIQSAGTVSDGIDLLQEYFPAAKRTLTPTFTKPQTIPEMTLWQTAS